MTRGLLCSELVFFVVVVLVSVYSIYYWDLYYLLLSLLLWHFGFLALYSILVFRLLAPYQKDLM